jgi:hypothetical protein
VFDVCAERQSRRTDVSGDLAAGRRLIGVVLMSGMSDGRARLRTDVAAFATVLPETVTNRFGLELAFLDGKSRARTRRVE